MTLAVDDDFGGFVAARWPDLEAVAIAAVLDPAVARELTTSSLAALGERWEAALEAGAPTREARVELLRRISRCGPECVARRDATGADVPPPAVRPTPDALGASDEPGSAVPAALLQALRAEEPLTRAALAAEAVWGCADDEVAGLAELAGIPVPTLTRGLADARQRLVAAHRGALAVDGLSPADWRLERDLTDVVDALAAAQPDPPDPAGLVADRTRRVHRRTLLAGGAAVLASGAAVSWLLRGAVAGEGAVGAAGPTTPTTASASSVGAADPVWGLTSQWPPRGSLVGDSGVQALVIRDVGAGGRLVYADDVEGLRVVVATVVQVPGAGEPVAAGPRGAETAVLDTIVRVWSGPAGAPAERLVPVELGLDRTEGAPDVVAVAVPGGVAASDTGYAAALGGALLVLSRPTVAAATWSPVVHPTVHGSVERTWTLITMSGGVGTRRLEAPLGAAARIQCGDYDGPIAGTRSWSASSPPRPSAAEVAAELVASATGVPRERLDSRVVVDSPVAGSVFDAQALSATGGDGRVQLVHTTTPDGGLVRTLVVADDGRSGRSTTYGPSAVLPAADAGQPLVRRLDLVPPRTMRYLVVAPGAARCQLLAVAPAGYPVSKVVPLKGDTAVVPIVNGQDSNTYRLVLWDARGRRTYSAVPPRGRALLDLEPPY